MPDNKVILDVRRGQGLSSVIDIHGEIDAFAEDALMDAYANASEGGTRIIVLNFDDLEYMNSSGIGLLVTLLIRANRQGQQLLAYGLSDHYRKVFELTRLDEAIRIFPSETEALATARAA